MKMEDAICLASAMLAEGFERGCRHLAPKTSYIPYRPVASREQIEAHACICKEFDKQEKDIKKGKDPRKAIKFATEVCEVLAEHGYLWPRDLLDSFKFRIRRLRDLIEHVGMDSHQA